MDNTCQNLAINVKNNYSLCFWYRCTKGPFLMEMIPKLIIRSELFINIRLAFIGYLCFGRLKCDIPKGMIKIFRLIKLMYYCVHA